MSKEFEVVETNKADVVCDGVAGDGHPRVFLHVNIDNGNVVCPYCSRKFVLINKNAA